MMYELGVGVEKNYEEAFEWYKKAADQGSTVAVEQIQSLVGLCHIDETRADPWLN